MNVELPPAPGYSGGYLRGPRSAGNTNGTEDAGAVIVRRGYTISTGTLVPDPAAAPLSFTDTSLLVGDVPWVTYEAEAAVAKFHGDLIVLGGRDPARGGWVEVDGDTRLARSAGTTISGEEDYDLAQNLFGWHPRGEQSRLHDARMVTVREDDPPITQPGDRYDRFQNAQRRAVGPVTTALASPLPDQATITIMHSRLGSETEDVTVLTLGYDLPAPRLTLYLRHGRGPDRETRWCPHDFGPLTLDTLVLDLPNAKAAALWRMSWPWGEPDADTLRRAVVTEGTG